MSETLNRELLAWVAAKIQDAQGQHLTGELRIQMHEGHIQRIRSERVYIPPRSDQQGADQIEKDNC